MYQGDYFRRLLLEFPGELNQRNHNKGLSCLKFKAGSFFVGTLPGNVKHNLNGTQ
jgi:hypothetical protein